MLKLMKYEFRKNRMGLAVMLGIAAGLFALAPLGRATDKEELMLISVFLLFTYAFAAYVYVLVRGISAYSGELRGRTGYLLMMVPRSTMSILFGKLLFTLFFALVMLAVSSVALMGAGTILLGEVYEVKGVLELMRFVILQSGIDPAVFASFALYVAVQILTSVLTIVAMGYLAVTLSATVLQGGKLRGLVSFLFFAALAVLTGYLQNWVSPAVEDLYAIYGQVMRAALPVILLDVALTCVYTALSAVLLKKKVSL